jgi:glyoxylate reductase
VKRQVVLTRRIAEECMKRLADHFQLEVVGGDDSPTKEEIQPFLQGKELLISTVTEKIDADLIHSAPQLRIICNFGVGFDNIDLQAATQKGILVTNTPDVLTDATADLTWALLLAVSRRLCEGDRLVRQKKWQGWTPTFMLGADVTGKTLGIIGMGRIGQAVAKRASGFSMRVLYFSRTRLSPELEKRYRVEYASLEKLLREADFISLHMPYSEETHHFIGDKEISQMKPTAFLINTSRGSIIDEQALLAALEAEQIAGAGLDVYEHEPHVPEAFMQMENVVLAPHLGSATKEVRIAMGNKVIENLLAYVRGERPPNLVNPEVWR